MKFFIPYAEDEDAAEQVYRTVARRCFKKIGLDVNPRRVFALRYRLQGSEYLAQVGVEHPPGNPEEVICILATKPGYLICTISKGVNYGMPIMIPHGLVSDVEYFNNVRDEIA